MTTVIVLPHQALCPEGAILEGTPGISLCELLLQHGIEIEHACELSCACTTCHVLVQEGYEFLEDPSETEEDLLDKAWGLTRFSRLSCQVIIGCTNIVVEIPRYTINLTREEATKKV